jgi:hypothetical protein
VVNVCVRVYNIFYRQVVGLGLLQKPGMIIGGIYEKTLSGLLISYQIAENTEIAHFNLSQNHDSPSILLRGFPCAPRIFVSYPLPLHHTVSGPSRRRVSAPNCAYSPATGICYHLVSKEEQSEHLFLPILLLWYLHDRPLRACVFP